jgi:8-oxo-dGTP pyrophosphatase MutT (NUDIX family)
VVAGLLFLLAIGWVTWLRLIKRDIGTDLFAYRLDIIRQTFKQQYDSTGALAFYDPFQASSGGSKRRRFGGLSDTVSIFNGFLAAGIAAVVVLPAASPLEDATMLGSAAIIALMVGGAVTMYQVTHADHAETEVKNKLPRLPIVPSHAGGVVCDVRGGVAHYILVHAKSKAEEWVLPQGHIEPGEDHAAAALREVQEEAGIVAAVLAFVGRVQFERNGRIQVTKFYLMQKLDEVDPIHRKEDRKPKWFSFEDAVRELRYPESQQIFRAGHERMQAMFAPTSTAMENGCSRFPELERRE